MKFEAIQHEDVKGNKTNYIKLTNDENESHFVNVGQKTYDAVIKLTKTKEAVKEVNNLTPKTTIK